MALRNSSLITINPSPLDYPRPAIDNSTYTGAACILKGTETTSGITNAASPGYCLSSYSLTFPTWQSSRTNAMPSTAVQWAIQPLKVLEMAEAFEEVDAPLTRFDTGRSGLLVPSSITVTKRFTDVPKLLPIHNIRPHVKSNIPNELISWILAAAPSSSTSSWSFSHSESAPCPGPSGHREGPTPQEPRGYPSIRS